MVGRRDFKLCILECKTIGFSSSGFHHLQHRIDPEHLALGGDQGGYGQCWLAGAGGNVHDGVASGYPRIPDKSIGNRRKHLPDDGPVLLPEWSDMGPSVENVLTRLSGAG